MSEIMLGVLRMPDELFWNDCPITRMQHNSIRKEAADEIERLRARLAEIEGQELVEGEEIMVNTPYDVFTLPLQPSGLGGKGPRFVVHVPGPEQQPYGLRVDGSDLFANAAHIAACDPDTIRALLAERDTLNAENERLRCIISDLKDWDCDVSGGFLSIPVDLRRRIQNAIAAYRKQGDEQ